MKSKNSNHPQPSSHQLKYHCTKREGPRHLHQDYDTNQPIYTISRPNPPCVCHEPECCEECCHEVGEDQFYATINDDQCFVDEEGTPLPSLRRTDTLYMEHLSMLAYMIPLVNNSAPDLPLDTYLKSPKLVFDLMRLKDIYEQNMNLVKKIIHIKQWHGRIDAYNPEAGHLYSKLEATYQRLSEIEKENLEIYHRIIQREPNYKNSEFAKDWIKAVENIRRKAKFPLIITGFVHNALDLMESPKSLTTFLALSRPRVFIDLKIRGIRNIGRLTIILFYDIVPQTCKQFYELCMNYKKSLADSNGRNPKLYPNYVNNSVSYIFPNLYAEFGEATEGAILDVEEAAQKDENFRVKHRHTGTLAVCKGFNDKATTRFTISFKPLPVMNGIRVAFGRVVHGTNALKNLEGYGTKHGQPLENIIVSNMGILKTSFEDNPKKIKQLKKS